MRGESQGRTTHDFQLTPMSGYGWTLLKLLTNKYRAEHTYLTEEEVAMFKQTTMGGFARRRFVQRTSQVDADGNRLYQITETAVRARAEFEAMDVMRKAESSSVSCYFGGKRNGGKRGGHGLTVMQRKVG